MFSIIIYDCRGKVFCSFCRLTILALIWHSLLFSDFINTLLGPTYSLKSRGNGGGKNQKTRFKLQKHIVTILAITAVM